MTIQNRQEVILAGLEFEFRLQAHALHAAHAAAVAEAVRDPEECANLDGAADVAEGVVASVKFAIEKGESILDTQRNMLEEAAEYAEVNAIKSSHRVRGEVLEQVAKDIRSALREKNPHLRLNALVGEHWESVAGDLHARQFYCRYMAATLEEVALLDPAHGHLVYATPRACK